MVKSIAFTSFFAKATKDTNGSWPSCKNQTTQHPPKNSDHEQNLIVRKITDKDYVSFDLSNGVGLTKSDRLFFELGYSSKSIMEAATTSKNIVEAAGVKVAQMNSTVIGPFRGGVALAMESKDPYRDFRESMEQMVIAHGAKDWDWLQEMLGWYLRANGKKTHGMILGAFVDLQMSLAKSDSSNLSNQISSCSSCSCFSFEIEEGIDYRR